jgi:hypothetical protein
MFGGFFRCEPFHDKLPSRTLPTPNECLRVLKTALHARISTKSAQNRKLTFV